MSNKPKPYPLIIGLLVPGLMVVVIAVSVFVPRLFAPPPQYDFIYSLSDGYYPEVEYFVSNSRVQMRDHKNPYPLPQNTAPTPVRLYRHYVKENRSAGISFEEAQKLIVSDIAQSPDGFEVGPGMRGDSFFFFYSSYPDYGSMRLKGHGVAHKLNLAQGQGSYYGYQGFRFLTWVIK